MKKVYEAPTVEKIAFMYRDQVVAASGDTCLGQYINTGDGYCPEDEQKWVDHYNKG